MATDNRSDLELAANGAANIYNSAKAGWRGLKKGLGIIKPTEQDKLLKLREKVSALASEKKALDEADNLKKAKAKLEEEIRKKKNPPTERMAYA